MFRPALLAAILVSSLFLPFCDVGLCASEGVAFDTSEERIGGLRLGMTEKALRGRIPCQPQKDRETFEEATGEYVQTWRFPECGIELKMGSIRKGGGKVVRSIVVVSPSQLRTGRGVRIGSTEAEVIEAYGRFRDPEYDTENKEVFVAGSVYDGLMFDFKEGRVTRIFLGAAAE